MTKFDWANEIMRDCLTAAGDDVEAGLVAGEILLSISPLPDEVEIEQEECDDDGNDPIPVDLSIDVEGHQHKGKGEGGGQFVTNSSSPTGGHDSKTGKPIAKDNPPSTVKGSLVHMRSLVNGMGGDAGKATDMVKVAIKKHQDVGGKIFIHIEGKRIQVRIEGNKLVDVKGQPWGLQGLMFDLPNNPGMIEFAPLGQDQLPQDMFTKLKAKAISLSIDAFFAYDIFNRQAQGILNRSLVAAKGLSAAARKDLEIALKKASTGSGEAILNFIDKYRVQLAKILTQTQIASILSGARQVADKIPTLTDFPGAIPPPPTLEPQEAIKLVERLETLTPEKRAEEIYKLPPAEQVYANQAIAVRAATPTNTPPIVPQRTGGGASEDIHLVTIDEAVKNLAERNVMDRQKYDALEASARAKAFTVANVQAEETLTKIRDSLAENIKEGADYETWRKKVFEDVEQGTFLSDAHQETVFRTNVQTGFSDGQEAILSNPLVRSGFPYRARDAIHDDRVRHNHLALEKLGIQGTNIYRADDPVWQLFRAPWDYNDRCSDTALTVRQAAEKGINEAKVWLETGAEPVDKAWVPMPDFQPPPGFRRTIASLPMSIQLSMQSVATFSTDKKPEESDTELLYGQSEGWGSITQGALDTANERSPRKNIKVLRAKTARGRRVRRSLFKGLRTKRKWKPSITLAVGDDDKSKRIDLMAQILVLMFGDKAQEVARQLKAHKSISLNLDAQGIWHGPTPPSSTGWTQIAPGPQGGLRWAHTGHQAAHAAQQSLLASGVAVKPYHTRKAAADVALAEIMLRISADVPLTMADKISVSKHLNAMSVPQLRELYKAVGGTGPLTGNAGAQAWAVRNILTGKTPPPQPTQLPAPTPIPTVTTPTPKSGKQDIGYRPEMNWSTGQPVAGRGLTLNGVDFASAPPKFWEKVQDVDVGEPPPLKKVNRVGIIIKEPDGRIWIVQPTNQFGNRKYTLPGGGVEQGLTDQQNALKEVWEETGLQVKITGHLGDFEDSNNSNNGRLYIGERIGGAPWDAKIENHIIDSKTGKPAAESSAVTLVTPDRAAKLLHRSDDLAQLITVHPIKVDTPVRGTGSNHVKKFVAGIAPAVDHYKQKKKAAGEATGNAELHVVQNMRGFNNKPKVIKKGDMDALISKGDHIELLRGVRGHGGKTAKALADMFRNGDHFPGHGVFGSGTYTDSNSGYNNMAYRYGAGGGGHGIRMALPKTAKIIKQSELERKVSEHPYLFSGYNSHGSARECWQGVQAALAGYDAIYVDGNSSHHGSYAKGVYVILNRSIVVVQKEDAKGHSIP